MSTATALRPTEANTAGHGGIPARRAVIRWAWRLFRREWRQELLVFALITVAVAATILGAAVATNTPPPADTGFGTADHLAVLQGSDPHLAADLQYIQKAFGTTDVIENRAMATGLVQGAQLRAQDPNGRFGRPMISLVAGRFPNGRGEVAMTAQLAATFDVQVGDLWTDQGRSLRVVGLVLNPQNLLDNFAQVPPGQLDSPSQATVLFDATSTQLAGVTFPPGVNPVTPPQSNGISPAIVVFGIAVIGLIFVGLVAVAGFTVLAQRRLRGLGMLTALGATNRNVRLVMVANGAAVGAIGAVVGAALGVAAWMVYAPHLARSAGHSIPWTNLPWWLVAATMLLAVVTATLAARRPGRVVARTPVMAALSGRPAVPKRAHRSAIPGIALLVLGPLLLAFSGGWDGGSSGKNSLFLLGGVLASSAGLLLIAPLTVAVLGLNADHAPVAVRIALRDLARYRARSGAALAATSFAVLIAMLITLVASGRFADPVDYFGPNLSANQVLLYTPGNSANGTDPLRTAATGQQGHPAQSQFQLQAAAHAIAATLGSRDILALDSAQVFLGQATPGALSDQAVRSGPGVVYEATPALLAHYGIKPATIDPDTLLLTSRPGLQQTAGLRLIYGDPQNTIEPAAGPPSMKMFDTPKIQTFNNLPTETSAPNLVITDRGIKQLNLPVTSGGWLIQTPTTPTAAQINTARQIAAEAGTTIEVKNDAPSLTQLRNDATLAGILLALAVLAMTVGLIRGENARELRTLTAAGATSHTRRNITAATAGTLGLLGAVLGTAVAYLAVLAFFHSQLSERMSHPPVLDLLLILLGLPAAAAVGGWLFAGRQPAAIARQSIE